MNEKELVAKEAANRVQNGMLVGLGTGSTANLFIDELARRHKEESLDVRVVSSSVVSAVRAESLGLPLVAVELLTRLDFYVDGADEVSPDLTLLKGRGSDLVKEKLLAEATDNFLVLIDSSKLVTRIGEKFPIPVEVIPFAWRRVKTALEKLGATGELRQSGGAVTSHGSLVLDMRFPESYSSDALNTLLNATPGVVEHGIFSNLASEVLLAENDQVKSLKP